MCSLYEHTLLWLVQPPLLFSITPPLPSPIVQWLSTHIIIFSTYTDITYFDIIDVLSFPFPPPLSSIEWFHYYKHVLHVSLYIVMLVWCVCL
jgi:hypothetical protein